MQRLGRPSYRSYIHLPGLEECDDPYSDLNSSKFIDDLTKWPAVEYCHIFGYFVTRPVLYTQEQPSHTGAVCR